MFTKLGAHCDSEKEKEKEKEKVLLIRVTER